MNTIFFTLTMKTIIYIYTYRVIERERVRLITDSHTYANRLTHVHYSLTNSHTGIPELTSYTIQKTTPFLLMRNGNVLF